MGFFQSGIKEIVSESTTSSYVKSSVEIIGLEKINGIIGPELLSLFIKIDLEGFSNNKFSVSGFNENLKLTFALASFIFLDIIFSILSSAFPSERVSSIITKNWSFFIISGKILGL